MTLGPVPRFLPAPLINARAAVMNPLFCQDLSKTARQVLYGVLTFYHIARPDQPVFAFQNKILPETFLNSRASLSRGLKEAEDKGYIRREQVRTWGARCHGQFSRSHIYLLDKARVMLGLADSAAPSITPPEPERFADDGEHAPSAPSQASILEAWEDGRADWEDDETGWEADTPPQEPTTVTPYATPCANMTCVTYP